MTPNSKSKGVFLKQEEEEEDGELEDGEYGEIVETLNTEGSQAKNNSLSDFFERNARHIGLIQSYREEKILEKKMQELSALQDKPKIGKKSEEIAKSKNKGVQLYKRVNEELQKKKQKIQKLKEVVMSKKDDQERMELEELKFAPDTSKGRKTKDSGSPFRTPEKGKATHGKTPEKSRRGYGMTTARVDRPRSANEFYQSMKTWTDKKSQFVAQQKLLKMTKEREELVFRPQINSKSKNSDRTKEKGGPYERLYDLAKERDENQQKLVEKYLSGTCSFKPKISSHTNRIIHKMEKRELVKQAKKLVESAKQPHSLGGSSALKNQNQMYQSDKGASLEGYKSSQGQSTEGIKVSQWAASYQNNYSSVRMNQKEPESPLDLSFGKEKKTQTWNQGSKSNQKVNLVDYQPEMDSIISKVNQEKSKQRSVTPQPTTQKPNRVGSAAKNNSILNSRTPPTTARKPEGTPEPSQFSVKREQTPPKPQTIEKRASGQKSEGFEKLTNDSSVPLTKDETRVKKGTSGRVNVIKKKK